MDKILVFMQHIWTIYNKSTHNCERSEIKIDEREIIQDLFINTLSFFTGKNNRSEIFFIIK